MSYRSLKQVLGETSLERKSRMLFGSCLLLLITGAFWWVDSIAEQLVLETTRSKGRDLVDMVLLSRHFTAWRHEKEVKEFAVETSEALEKNRNYAFEILTLDPNMDYTNLNSKHTTIPWERDILLDIKQQYDAKKKMLDQAGPPEDVVVPLPPPLSTSGPQDLTKPGGIIFRDRTLRGEANQYLYYEPVYWQDNCVSCHDALANLVLGAADSGMSQAAEPFVVMKIIIPYEETQDAINHARAILIAVAILTVFVAMVALYVIFRYVVVRPLKHLRDVSDEVSRGKTELRAEIRTADEFQDLAESFNRMLRHLTETQGELREVNAALDGKVDQLAQLNMQLYEMNRLKSDFLANMSHELRTPLNSIIGFSEVLAGIDSLTDKQKRYAQNIQKSGRLLLDMINDILDLAKMEAGKMEIRPTEFRVDTVVSAQCDMVRSLTEDKNIDLDVQVQSDLPPMFQDQAKLQQILTNLLSNAIKFTPEGGRITVTAGRSQDGRHLELSVADTGVGIAKEDREIIFEKFRQSSAVIGEDGLTREYSGTGLGLSIIKELCKLLCGLISFESEVGKGSRFRVVLPWVASTATSSVDLSRSLDELGRAGRSSSSLGGTPSSALLPSATTESPADSHGVSSDS